MYLVGIHAQVTSAAELLLDRILNMLVNELAEEALRCFRQVKRFGMGGMLRVRPLLIHCQPILMNVVGNS
jgi:exocyst complex component 2